MEITNQLNSFRIENKKTIFFLLLLIIFFSSIPLLFPGLGFSIGQDGIFHLMRIEGIADELIHHHFPVRLQQLWLDGYGYPVSIYYGDIFLYFPAFLRIIGVSLDLSYKIYILFVNIFTVIISFICFKRIFNSNINALLLSLIYTTAPYRLVNIFIRNAVGEYSAFVFFPIITLAFFYLYKESNHQTNVFYNSVLLAIGMSGVILTHIISTEMVVFTLIAICLVFWKKTFTKKVIICLLLAILFTFLICSFFIIPFLDYFFTVPVNVSQINTRHIQSGGVYLIQLLMFFQKPFGQDSEILKERMLFSPGLPLMTGFILALVYNFPSKFKLSTKSIRFISILIITGLISLVFYVPYFQNLIICIGEKYIGRQLTHEIWHTRFINYETLFLAIIAFLIILTLVANYSTQEKCLIYLLEASIISIWLSSNLFPWDFISKTKIGNIIAQIQFAWRWLGIVMLFLTLLSGYLFFQLGKENKIKKCNLFNISWIRIVMLILVIIQFTVFCFQYRFGVNFTHIKDYHSFGTRYVMGQEYIRLGSNIENLDGEIKTENDQLSNINRNGNTYTFTVSSINEGYIELPVFNYKGYQACYDNDKQLLITDGTNNVVRIIIPKEFNADVVFSFKQPLLWKISCIISLVSLVLLFVILILHFYKFFSINKSRKSSIIV